MITDIKFFSVVGKLASRSCSFVVVMVLWLMVILSSLFDSKGKDRIATLYGYVHPVSNCILSFGFTKWMLHPQQLYRSLVF